MKIHKCIDCNDVDEKNFYPKQKNRCKKCQSKLAKSKDGYLSQPKEWNKKNVFRSRFLGARNRAKYKGSEFTISIENIIDLAIAQENKCYYTGTMFNNECEFDSISIDRIDSTKGYTLENIRLVTSAVNYMKSNHSEEMFYDLVLKIYNNKLK